MHQLVGCRTSVEGLLEGSEGQVCAPRPGDQPADDASSEDIDDDGDVDKAQPDRDVRQVRQPPRTDDEEASAPRDQRVTQPFLSAICLGSRPKKG